VTVQEGAVRDAVAVIVVETGRLVLSRAIDSDGWLARPK